MNIGSAICFVWETLARPRHIVAVLAILVVHYRSDLLYIFQTAMNDGFVQTFFNLILNLADTLRGYYHVSHEIIRGLGQYQIFSFLNENYSGPYARRPSRQRESVTFQKSENVSNRNNNHKTNSSVSPLPELVEVRNCVIHEENAVASTGNASASAMATTGSNPSILKNELAPLEPAFLSKEDYPPGWLVYHPVLGLTSVEEADKHDEQQSSEKHVRGDRLSVSEEKQS